MPPCSTLSSSHLEQRARDRREGFLAVAKTPNNGEAWRTPSRDAFVADWSGAGFLNRMKQVRFLPRAQVDTSPRGRTDRRWSSKPADAGSTPAEDAALASSTITPRPTSARTTLTTTTDDDERRRTTKRLKKCLVMRLASQIHCLWIETGSIPVRGADWVAESWRPTGLQNPVEKVRFLRFPLRSRRERDTTRPNTHPLGR